MPPRTASRVPAALRPDSRERLARDIADGFAATPRSIPWMYLYDAAGAALFDEITRLPEYYLPRAEAEILRAYAEDMLDRIGPGELVELGAGSATRTRILLDAVARRGWPVAFTATDARRALLADCAQKLRREYPGGRFEGVLGDYFTALAGLVPRRDRTLVFLGGAIGNLHDPEIAALGEAAARALEPGGHFLIGFDRDHHARKPADLIFRAYNDSQGVTARFNLNLLARLNRELSADFDPGGWAHEATYDADAHQVEMRLVCVRDQVVRIGALDVAYEFHAGERVLTQISRRFESDRLARLLSGFALIADWTDGGELFGMALFRRTRAG